MPKLKTIKVSGGGDYAKVAERLKEFHSQYKTGKIETSYNLTEAMICFKAIITPDTTKPERYFTGHSLGAIKGVKAFEKLETIAVGRALAFLGLLADGDIASADEMETYKEELGGDIDPSEAIAKLGEAEDENQLKVIWKNLSEKERQNKEVLSLKDFLKEEFNNQKNAGQ
ncbi:MAG: hypothetical protein BWY21_01997 [Parcubacteria group bacterium ADurb.Bin216]|nr:MAG: hypothetical protein BWY21_01997 [Parcubacteria group bacterium ADurb.Bin216]